MTTNAEQALYNVFAQLLYCPNLDYSDEARKVMDDHLREARTKGIFAETALLNGNCGTPELKCSLCKPRFGGYKDACVTEKLGEATGDT